MLMVALSVILVEMDGHEVNENLQSCTNSVKYWYSDNKAETNPLC